MEAPIECFSPVTLVTINGNEIVEIPTAEVWTPGDFLSRRYAGVSFAKVRAHPKMSGKYGSFSVNCEGPFAQP